MKKFSLLIIGLVCVILMSGCIKQDDMQNITIYTTVYPIEYVTNYLYGDNATVLSVYPNGVVPSEYKFTNKQLKDYSKSSLFIFNGMNDEKDLVTTLFNYNNQIKIIDATSSIEVDYAVEEMWLNPSNLLMLAQNVKNGLNEYVNNGYLKTSINDKYNNLKIEISNLDAKMKLMAENSKSSVILISSNMFKFLGDKYNFNIVTLDGEGKAKSFEQAREYANNGQIDCIFVPMGEELNDDVKALISELNLKTIELHTLTNITSDERKEKEDYLSIMNDNMELIRNVVYK